MDEFKIMIGQGNTSSSLLFNLALEKEIPVHILSSSVFIDH